VDLIPFQPLLEEKKCLNAKPAIHTSYEPSPQYKKKERKERFYIKYRSFVQKSELGFISTQNKVEKVMTLLTFSIVCHLAGSSYFPKNTEPWMEYDGPGKKQ